MTTASAPTAAVLQPREGYAESEGLHLHYRIAGHGPVCLAHPGGPAGDSRYFADLAGLTEFLTVVFYDARGSERSGAPADPTRYGLPDHAADVEALRLHLGLDTFIFLGHSHGGWVAQQYALDYPHGVSHLILASTTARLSAEVGQRMLAAVERRKDEPWYPAARTAFDREWAGQFATGREMGELYNAILPFYFAEWDAAAQRYAELFKGVSINPDAVKYFNLVEAARFDFRPRLTDIQVPTLVLTGEDDFVADVAAARELAAGIAHAQLRTMPGCGHFTFIGLIFGWDAGLSAPALAMFLMFIVGGQNAWDLLLGGNWGWPPWRSESSEVPPLPRAPEPSAKRAPEPDITRAKPQGRTSA